MRKVPPHLDNPIESSILDFGDWILPFLKKTNHTPNILTTYSFILGLLSLYYLYQRNIHIFATLYFLSFVFDCLDGHMARLYNMYSKFGDFYDHFTDFIVGFGLIIILFKNYRKNISIYVIIFYLIMLFLMNLHVGCQQMYFKNNQTHSESLDIYTKLCINPEYIKYTRFLGVGTFYVFTIFLVYYLQSK
jgi:phosphatidylglycerophosphate synthase